MYKLYTDKKEMFECDISLSGASLKDATARLIIETDTVNLLYKGTIGSSGNCKVPVHRLRGLLDETAKGKIKLEVIAEDTYFIPWESDFSVETSKSVTVEIKSQSPKVIKETVKPKMAVKVKKPLEEDIFIEDDAPTITETQHAVNLLKLLIKEDINMTNISIKRNRLNNIVATYIQENPIDTSKRGKILGSVVKVLAKRK
tara:strand:+ start:569 stop:1171 length:603 start_codon:yes stop_codon:yes gene_type:complete